MFKTRLISGIVLIVIALFVLWIGGAVTGAVTMILSAIGVYEFCRVYDIEKRSPTVIALIWTFVYYLVLILADMRTSIITKIDPSVKSAVESGETVSLTKFTIPIMILYLLAILTLYVFRFPKYHDREIMAAFTSFFYVSVMLSFVYKLRTMYEGGYFIVLVFICSWGNDTLAYCAGRLFGKHKMSPELSPKKTVEGLIGGIVGSGLLGVVYAFFLKGRVEQFDNMNIYITLFIVCALGAIPAVIGDLAASAIKRNNNVKDYGTLIPGHGGVLDRFDSMIFTAPIIYYLIQFVITTQQNSL